MISQHASAMLPYVRKTLTEQTDLWLLEVSSILKEQINKWETGVDLRSLGGLHSCLCGSELWHIVCKFSEGEICFYYLDMVCVSCGAFAKAPIPTDDLD